MSRTRPWLFALVLAGGASFAAPAPERPAGSATDKKVAALSPTRLGDSAKLDRAIATYFGTLATERTYIQTDKPLYQPGETIWFRADVRATRTLTGGAPGGVTVELVSPRGAVVATRRVLVQNGVARNDLALAADLDGGEYAIQLTTDRGTRDTPGHEALTAYGLMEFADMAKVYDVDRRMVERTADWLMSRRDGQGGFARSAQALDSFGRAGPATTDAYILWALAEARRTAALGKELGVQKALGNDTRDPYLLALAANTNLIAAPKAADTAAMVKKLAAMQARDGGFPGAKESITMSGGESLTIETTSLAVLALLKASPGGEYEPQIRAGVDWINARRGGHGAWGNTQATILGLKALTAYAEHARQMAAPGSATLVINGRDAGTIRFDRGRRDALVWDDIAGKLAAGKNAIELRLDSAAALPYTISVDYRSTQPRPSPQAKLAVSTRLLRTQARMGEGVTLRAHVENTTAAGIPMTLARVGIPGGLVFQTWQLKELRDRGAIDFYETRPREVILYWRALPPSARKDIDLQLLAAVPGSYEAPASSAYLYYTAEDKAWTPPVAITIDRYTGTR